MNKYRSHNCSELTEADSDKKVYLSGWLHRKRDHGNLLFIDLRDHFGITQCVIENKNKYKALISILSKENPKIKGINDGDKILKTILWGIFYSSISRKLIDPACFLAVKTLRKVRSLTA